MFRIDLQCQRIVLDSLVKYLFFSVGETPVMIEIRLGGIQFYGNGEIIDSGLVVALSVV